MTDTEPKVTDAKSLLQDLSREYDELTETRNNLEKDCKALQDQIQNQIQRINDVNEDITKLRAEYQEQLQNIQNAKKDEQQSEGVILYLVDENTIKNPATVSQSVEIRDNSVICATCFSPNGANLAIGSDKVLRVYNFEHDCFVLEAPFADPNTTDSIYIRSITWTPNSSQVIAGAEDHTIYIFNISQDAASPEKSDPTPCARISTAGQEVFQVQCFKDGNRLAASLGDGSIQIWNIKTMQKITQLVRSPEKPCITISISNDSKIIAAGYSDGFVAFWNLETQSMIFEQNCHSMTVYSCIMLPKYNRIVTSSLDKTVKIWDIIEGGLSLWKTLDKHSEYVLSLALDPTENWLISGSKDMTCIITRLDEGRMIYQLKSHENSVITVSFSPLGNMFCSGSGDMYVKIWTFTQPTQV
ncbi:hypothetical protein TVAG_375270 [Trichomonas vaginalis G3]|uniref:Uncharacterized protein n=1 Tax=Trichomonas vaginalis (strain ATCC PRA-98 / G3) TaxID=412133 RepID=A2FH05_TRIV3|nr:WD repeat-containing protein family [Trichomonas vaginalis G3]EAX95818.1 hypothetical protein TVAG_375270 [Trichomonas vaginalis G3]KAI5500552.1 WD repeat-containing protein family [Trichomonas vaginalis G3]|eukprot:XP_001308748.1 hypothetical protein [Trichomonas vaginalis G3]